METSRDDFGIAIRSAFFAKGTKQKFSLLALVVLSVLLIFLETLESKPISFFRSLVKDVIYRGSVIIHSPFQGFDYLITTIDEHNNLYNNYSELKKENDELRNNISKSDFLKLENKQLRKLIEEPNDISSLVSARVMLDNQNSPYLNSFIINVGANKKIKNGLAVLDGKNFIGRTVDVNFFSSRVLLVSDLNSKIPVIVEPSANHAILDGHGKNRPSLEYLPENYNIQDGNKVYTSGKEGIFFPGIPIGEVKIKNDEVEVLLFSDLSQITFVNINLKEPDNN